MLTPTVSGPPHRHRTSGSGGESQAVSLHHDEVARGGDVVVVVVPFLDVALLNVGGCGGVGGGRNESANRDGEGRLRPVHRPLNGEGAANVAVESELTGTGLRHVPALRLTRSRSPHHEGGNDLVAAGRGTEEINGGAGQGDEHRQDRGGAAVG